MVHLNMMNAALYINIFTAIVVLIVGILIISGYILPQLDFQSRLIFGIVFISYAVYRYLNLQSKRKLMKQDRDRERMKHAKEDLIKRNKKY